MLTYLLYPLLLPGVTPAEEIKEAFTGALRADAAELSFRRPPFF